MSSKCDSEQQFRFIAHDDHFAENRREVYRHARRDAERTKHQRIEKALLPAQPLPLKAFEPPSGLPNLELCQPSRLNTQSASARASAGSKSKVAQVDHRPRQSRRWSRSTQSAQRSARHSPVSFDLPNPSGLDRLPVSIATSETPPPTPAPFEGYFCHDQYQYLSIIDWKEQFPRDLEPAGPFDALLDPEHYFDGMTTPPEYHPQPFCYPPLYDEVGAAQIGARDFQPPPATGCSYPYPQLHLPLGEWNRSTHQHLPPQWDLPDDTLSSPYFYDQQNFWEPVAADDVDFL